MSTSGSTIGISPAAMICAANSNCWFTMALMPAALACMMTERILVPKMRFDLAFASSSASAGMGFISWTPSFSASSPLSTFRNGTTPLTFHRYLAAGCPWISLSIVFSKRMAPMIRSPLNAGLVIMRVRISCTIANISSSLFQVPSLIPYKASAFGVLPPL